MKMRLEPNDPPAYLPPRIDPVTVWLKVCAEESGGNRGVRLDVIRGSRAPLSFPLCPVGGAAAVLREVLGVSVRRRAEGAGCGRNWRLGDWPRNNCRGADARRRGWARAREGQIPRSKDYPALGTWGREKRERGAVVLPEGDWAPVAAQTEPESIGYEG